MMSQNRTQPNITLCGNQTYEQEQTFKLSASMYSDSFTQYTFDYFPLDKTFAELPKPLCLNENEHYKLQLQLKKYGHGDNPRDPVISIDSVYD